ncbi:MAG: NAD(P)/FAD-dependent oxidoreductase [Candidatus Delongbacteria bacterium]|nr:NAD(P)/FAD-dependent oxidoreductase [Candidatus Delongbacteria bacterium]
MKKVVIIGSGVSGLAAGIHAIKSGFETLVLEKNPVPGGECTGWDRRGYHIDGCIHWMMGTHPDSALFRAWCSVGALGDQVEVYQPDCFNAVQMEGRIVKLYRDRHRFRQQLLDLSPADSNQIDFLCRMIEESMDFQDPPMKAFDLMNGYEIIKTVLSMRKKRRVMKSMSMSVEDYVKRFKSPIIRRMVMNVIPPFYSAFVMAFTLGSFMSGNGDIPMGRSKAMSLRMVERFKALGGTLELSCPVREIIVDYGRASGVTTAEGQIISADYIIPSCNIHHTMEDLLNSRYRIHDLDKMDRHPESYPIETCVLAAFSLDRELQDFPHSLAVITSAFGFEDSERDTILIGSYSDQSGFAPSGKSVITVMLNANYDWWKEKRRDLIEYRKEKNRIGWKLMEIMEREIPEWKGGLELLDVATPITFERYCHAYRGGYMAYAITPHSGIGMLPGRIGKIRNLFPAGQSMMMPGGLPVALISGIYAVQRICAAEKIKWSL